MAANGEELELKDRLSLIENMIAEGRRTTESWGWTFVLWGVAYYIAIAWATWGHSALAWPVTMIAAGVLMGILATRNAGRRPGTTIGRAMMAIWLAMGISIFALMFSLGVGGRLDLHISVAIIGAMLGSANATSSIILKWKMQFVCAVVWWTAGVASVFLTENQVRIVFLAAIFFCQIVFGLYAMILDARRRRQVASHA
jgi:fatty acid desaturase